MSEKKKKKWTKEAHALMDSSYKRMKLEYADIADIIYPLQYEYEEAEVIAAIKSHVMDARERDNSIVGKWPPSTADLVWHLRNMRKEESRLKKEKAFQPVAIPQSNIVSKDVPSHMKRYFKQDQVEVYTNKSAEKFVTCSICHDTGRVNFYRDGVSSDMSDQVDVYTKQEYLDMSEAAVKMLKLTALQCVCGCDKGEELWAAFKGKPKRPWHIQQVERYAHNRKIREAISVKSDG